jgi:hypothetical protein
LSNSGRRGRLSRSGGLERGAGLRELLLGSSEVGIRLRSTGEVLVRVETTDGGNVSDVGKLKEVAGLIVVVIAVRVVVALRIVASGVLVSILLTSVAPAVVLAFRVAHLLGHGRQRNTLRQVRKRINEASLLSLVVIERAGVTELAGTSFLPVLARNGFIVGVNRTKSSLAEIFGKRLK